MRYGNTSLCGTRRKIPPSFFLFGFVLYMLRIYTRHVGAALLRLSSLVKSEAENTSHSNHSRSTKTQSHNNSRYVLPKQWSMDVVSIGNKMPVEEEEFLNRASKRTAPMSSFSATMTAKR